MKMPQTACVLALFFLLFATITSCKKDDENANPNNPNPDLATVSTDKIEDITPNSARIISTVSNEGKSAVIGMGIAWGKSPNPTVAGGNFLPSTGFGLGTYSLIIPNLELSTTYYVRSYATNAVGTAYSEQKTFTTLAGLVDIDGNVYPTVQIGTQTWMKTNLKTTRYRDGSAINTGLSDSQWQSASSGAYAIYDNNAANDATYGKLYNGYAVADSRGLCPAGWHVPTDAEWKTLETQLGMPASELEQTGWRGGAQKVGGKLKAVSPLWLGSNTGATDESGFSGLPGGIRNGSGSYQNFGYGGDWWSSSELSTTSAWGRYLESSDGNSGRDASGKQNGFSVRCLRD